MGQAFPRESAEQLLSSLAALAGSLSDVAFRLIEYHRERSGSHGRVLRSDGVGEPVVQPTAGLRHGDAAGLSVTAEPAAMRHRASDLRRIWLGYREPAELAVGETTIRCDSRTGRFELLLLAVLYAARVQRHWAERTLAALRQAGWSDRGIRETLGRLGFVAEPRDRRQKSVLASAARQVIQRYFDGDCLPVYFQGKAFCPKAEDTCARLPGRRLYPRQGARPVRGAGEVTSSCELAAGSFN